MDAKRKLGRPTLGEDKLEVAVLVKVSAAQRDQLKAAAKVDGKPLGRWLRDMGLARARRLEKRQEC